jgi:hypothetical protein
MEQLMEQPSGERLDSQKALRLALPLDLLLDRLLDSLSDVQMVLQ